MIDDYPAKVQYAAAITLGIFDLLNVGILSELCIDVIKCGKILVSSNNIGPWFITSGL